MVVVAIVPQQLLLHEAVGYTGSAYYVEERELDRRGLCRSEPKLIEPDTTARPDRGHARWYVPAERRSRLRCDGRRGSHWHAFQQRQPAECEFERRQTL